jgi:hypothetical protein
MRPGQVANRFDRISRHPLLPTSAALIISAAMFEAYSYFTASVDVRAVTPFPADAPPIDASGTGTIAGDGVESERGNPHPAASAAPWQPSNART